MAQRNINTEAFFREIELLHDSGLYVSTRTIYMGSEEVILDDGESGCDAKMAERFIKNMLVLEHLSHDPITIILNNIGGDEYHGFAIYDAIKLSPCKTIIKVRGHAMSMGSIILQAANKRIMGPTATQMIHYGTWFAGGHAKTAQKTAKEGERLDKWMEDMYLERIREAHPRYKLEELQKLLDHDTFFTAEESIELGLADEIG